MKREFGAVLTLAAALATAGTLLAGCTPEYGRVELDAVAGSDPATVSSDGITVVEGATVVFEADLRADFRKRGRYDAIDEVRFSSNDDAIARVVPGLHWDVWIVLGGSVGVTQLDVIVNGQLEDTIDVEVVVQPEVR